MRTRIIIADDHSLVLEGLTRVLEKDYEIVATASTGRQLLQQVERLLPRLVLLDVGMPEMNGIEAAIRINTSHPGIKMIFMSQQMDRDTIRAAFEAGAEGYVGKQSPSQELLKAIPTVLRGDFYVTPNATADGSLPEIFIGNPAQLFGSQLTARQREVLQLVAEGKPMKVIAMTLKISIKTVEFHKGSLMRQLNMNSTAELIRYAIAQHIVSA